MTEFIESIENVSLHTVYENELIYVFTHRLGHLYPNQYFAFT